MANDIKQKIVLEGEKEYNRALSEAKRNLKTLRSELKAETAELGANATAQQKNEKQIKSLQKQIKEQEKIVKTYQEALKEVKEKYSDNEDAIAKWEVKLNDARTSLANMKNELDNVGKGFDNVQSSADMATVASKSVADAFGQLGSIGDTISSTIENIFTGMLDTIKGAVTEVWDMIAETAAKANNWTDLASYYGTTASEIEKINKAVEWSQGNFQDFTNLLNQLAWGGKGKKITEWFNVSDVNYEDKLEYAMDVLQQMENMQKEDPKKLSDAMEDIFGAKKSQQIMWFVSNLEQVQKNLKTIEEKGYNLGDENIETMNNVWLELGEIEGKWESLKQKFSAGFGTVTLDIMANVNSSLDALMDYFSADNDADRQKALDELTKNITEAFNRIAQAIQDGIKILDDVATNLKNSDDPTAQALGGILSGIVEALKWITEDNMKNVVSALEILAGFWLVGKGLKLASTLAEVAANIKTIKLFGSLNTGLFGSGTGAGMSGVGTSLLTKSVITEAITAAAGPIAAAIAGLTMTVGVAVIALPALKALYDVLRGDVQPWMDYGKAEQITKETKPLNELTASDARTALQWLLGNTGYREETEIGGNVGTTGTAIPVRRTPKGNFYYIGANEEQQAAANTWWDIYKENPIEAVSGGAFVELADAFYGSEDILEQLLALVELMEQNQKDNEFSNLEDLPAEWWTGTGSQNSLTSDDISGLRSVPGQMAAAVQKGVSGIKVTLDGYKVGSLVAPYVSQMIARDIG